MSTMREKFACLSQHKPILHLPDHPKITEKFENFLPNCFSMNWRFLVKNDSKFDKFIKISAEGVEK